jgi:hypothetical protein
MPAGVSAYTALANVTLGSAATTVTFSSISQSYRDLVLVSSIRVTAGSAYARMRFNNDTGNNYFAEAAWASAATELSDSFLYFRVQGYSPNTAFMTSVTNILDFTASDKHKPLLMRTNTISDSGVEMQAIRWANTSAITSLAISSSSGNIDAGSTFALYGVSA